MNTNPARSESSNIIHLSDFQHSDLEAFVSEVNVEFYTVPGFLQLLKHEKPWEFAKINKFGRAMVQTAEAWGIKWRDAMDGNLAEIRAFPLKLMMYVYRETRKSLGWPELEFLPEKKEVQVPAQEEEAAQAAQAAASAELQEGLQAHLRMWAELSKDPNVRAAADTLMKAVGPVKAWAQDRLHGSCGHETVAHLRMCGAYFRRL